MLNKLLSDCSEYFLDLMETACRLSAEAGLKNPSGYLAFYYSSLTLIIEGLEALIYELLGRLIFDFDSLLVTSTFSKFDIVKGTFWSLSPTFL